MKFRSILILVVLGLFGASAPAQPQSVAYLGCVVPSGSHGPCPPSGTNYLQGLTWPVAVPSVVIVGGYAAPGDGGGGEFAAGAACPNPTSSFGGTTQAPPSANTITGVASTAGLAPGYTISDSNGYIPGAAIASLTTNTITITQNATMAGSTTLSASGDNGGTQIQDANPSTRCWYKTNYRGDPHEFGAVGDDHNDDTAAVQDWLGA
ncbi:MAG: hypothetical protein ACRELF_28240 [Gemmataceae bacterium]